MLKGLLLGFWSWIVFVFTALENAVFEPENDPPPAKPQPVPKPPVEVKPAPPAPKPVPLPSLNFAFGDDEYSTLLNNAVITRNKSAVLANCKRISANRARYEGVKNAPWWIVGIIHSLEAGFNFKTCLHNGDALPGPTHHVPAGRGPFTSWEAAAADALELQHADRIKTWNVEMALGFLERYNGMGYRKHGINSPYLWSFTNQYTRGKYIADGVWSSGAVSQQVGACAMILGFKELGVHLEGIMVGDQAA